MADQPNRRQRRKQRGSGADAMGRGYAKAEIKNQKAREALEPLTNGQRPGAVTVGAVFAAVIAILIWGSALFGLVTDTRVNGKLPNFFQLALYALIISLMAWGMWKSRYWAVLGFQMLLVILILAAALGLVLASGLLQAIGDLILVVGLSLLFYFLIKAMARIQMPDRPGR